MERVFCGVFTTSTDVRRKENFCLCCTVASTNREGSQSKIITVLCMMLCSTNLLKLYLVVLELDPRCHNPIGLASEFF